MCTVIVSFDPDATWPVVMLGLRDEAVDRPWDPPGAWWPELGPTVRGVRDRSAGGAWLAVNTEAEAKASVVLNRHEDVAQPAGGYVSRGVLPLADVTDPRGVTDPDPRTRAFNLVSMSASAVSYTTWDGTGVSVTSVQPGVHMITHEGPDVASVPREVRWLPAFRSASRPAGDVRSGSWREWLDVLTASSELPPSDDEALFRDSSVDGHHYASLSVTAVALPASGSGVALSLARLASPGHLGGELDWQ